MREEAESVVSAELGAGEPLLWCGRPKHGIRLTFGGVFALLVSVAVPVLVLGVPMLSFGPVSFFSLCWLVIVAGLYFVFGRAIAAAIRLGHTFYGLTPRRAIIVSGVVSRRARSIDLASVGELSGLERPDRSGTISLGPPPTGLLARPSGVRGLFWPNTTPYVPDAFEMIDDVKSVHGKIERARQGP